MARGAKVQDEEKDEARQEWSTPRALFDGLNAEFRFTVDACALEHNAKLPNFWTPQEDGLVQKWEGERVFCNPPYNDIGPWMARGYSAVRRDPSTVCVYLVPARTGAAWFHTYALRGLVDFFRGRIAFDIPSEVRDALVAMAETCEDEKLAAKYERQAKGSGNAEDSIVVILSAVKLIQNTGIGEIAGVRDPITGRRIMLEPVQEVLPFAGGLLNSTAYEHAEPCRLCGQANGARVWSSLTVSEVHEPCLQSALEDLKGMNSAERREAEVLLRGEAQP